jgi:secretion/DNA translocation related CpaE-like protein
MTSSSPLLVSQDDRLVADLQRLAAAAGTALDVAAEPAAVLASWPVAPVVLVGADQVTVLAGSRPARRDRVHVVSSGPLPDGLFRGALALGAEGVVELPAGDAWLVETLTDSVDGAAREGRVVTVLGGSGGVGATMFAAALATVGAADGHPVTLVDADPLGAGVERVVGLDDTSGAGWESLVESTGRFGSRSLRGALPQRDALAVLGWGAGARIAPGPETAREVISAARRGSGLVVVDAPRHLTPMATEILVRSDQAVVVTGLTLPAVAAAARVVAAVRPVVPAVHLVARGPASALDPTDVARALKLPLAAAMRDQRRLDEAVDLGLGPVRARRGPLARAARCVLTRLLDDGAPGITR